MDFGVIFAATALGYVLGSIPFGYLITKTSGQGDIRDIGSGNIGATNVMRTGRKELAILTLVLDAGKAALAVILVGHFFGPPYGLMAGAAALLGHCFPVWLKFNGGKGVAAFFGVLLSAYWPLGLAVAGLWIVTAITFKMSSMAALIAAIGAPIMAFALGLNSIGIMSTLLAVVIFIRHKDNIIRILNGTEPKIGRKN